MSVSRTADTPAFRTPVALLAVAALVAVAMPVAADPVMCTVGPGDPLTGSRTVASCHVDLDEEQGGNDFDVGGWVMFNPQPEPPGEPFAAGVQTQGSGIGHGFAAVAFNPQPEPPGDWFHVWIGTRGNPAGNPGCEVGFNPQPEPPGEWCTP